MNGMKDPLADVPQEDIPTFLELCKNNFPEAIHAYSYVRTLITWKKLRPDLHFEILAPQGDYRKGVIFYSIIDRVVFGSVYAQDEESKTKLQNALRISKKIPLKENFYLLTSMSEISFKVIEPLLSGVWLEESKDDWRVISSFAYWMPWQEAKEMTVHIPEGVEIRYLKPCHAVQIDAIWPHRFTSSKDRISEMIELCFGMGVFRGEELLSWALLCFYGGIGIVQTEEKEMRRGYGRAAVEAITKEMGNRGLDVNLGMKRDNFASQSFFKSLGFRFIYNSEWVVRGY